MLMYRKETKHLLETNFKEKMGFISGKFGNIVRNGENAAS